jgi:hypothetical protein
MGVAMAKVVILPALLERLHQVMIYEEELFAALKGQSREAVPGVPGAFLCRCSIPVPRPMDPETAEMHPFTVYVRPGQGDGEGTKRWEIYKVDGIENLETIEGDALPPV